MVFVFHVVGTQSNPNTKMSFGIFSHTNWNLKTFDTISKPYLVPFHVRCASSYRSIEMSNRFQLQIVWIICNGTEMCYAIDVYSPLAEWWDTCQLYDQPNMIRAMHRHRAPLQIYRPNNRAWFSWCVRDCWKDEWTMKKCITVLAKCCRSHNLLHIPCDATTFHMVCQCYIIAPDVELPFPYCQMNSINTELEV